MDLDIREPCLSTFQPYTAPKTKRNSFQLHCQLWLLYTEKDLHYVPWMLPDTKQQAKLIVISQFLQFYCDTSLFLTSGQMNLLRITHFSLSDEAAKTVRVVTEWIVGVFGFKQEWVGKYAKAQKCITSLSAVCIVLDKIHCTVCKWEKHAYHREWMKRKWKKEQVKIQPVCKMMFFELR